MRSCTAILLIAALVSCGIHLLSVRESHAAAVVNVVGGDQLSTQLTRLNAATQKLDPSTIGQIAIARMAAGLSAAEKALMNGDTCAATDSLIRYLDDAQRARQRTGAGAIDVLYSDARTLLTEMLEAQIGADRCPGLERLRSPASANLGLGRSDVAGLSLNVRFGPPRFITTMQGASAYTQLRIENTSPLARSPGQPMVPAYRALFAAPPNARVTVAHEVIEAERLTLRLAPYQDQPFPGSEDEGGFDLDPEAYLSSTCTPEQAVRIVSLGDYRDLPIYALVVAAGQYQPSADKLTLFDEVAVRIEFTGGSDGFRSARQASPFEPPASSYTGFLINGREVEQHLVADPFQSYVNGEELMILTHPKFRVEADELAAWRRDQGIITKVYEVGTGTSRETPEAIDELIESQYRDALIRPSYVLLLGDAEFIAPPYYKRSGWGPYPADIIYGIIGDLPGETDPLLDVHDFIPDIGVARIPVDTRAQAQDVVSKIVGYQMNPPGANTNYRSAAISSNFECCRMDPEWEPLFGPFFYGWARAAFIANSEYAVNALRGLDYDVKRIYTVHTVSSDYIAAGGDPTPRRYNDGTPLPDDIGPGSGFDWTGDEQDVIDAYNEGQAIIIHHAHGGWAGQGPPTVDSGTVAALAANDITPLVIHHSCNSAFFDNETCGTPDEPDCGAGGGLDSSDETYSEALIRAAQRGAVAEIGAVRGGGEVGNGMLHGYFDAIRQDKRRLGDIMIHSYFNMFLEYSDKPEGCLKHAVLFTAFGDPTWELWTSTPIILEPIDDIFLYPEGIELPYPLNGAVVTAAQVVNGMQVPLGRGVVQDGNAVIELMQEVSPGTDVSIAIHYPNAMPLRWTGTPILAQR